MEDIIMEQCTQMTEILELEKTRKIMHHIWMEDRTDTLTKNVIDVYKHEQYSKSIDGKRLFKLGIIAM